MFVIKPKTAADWAVAEAILAESNVFVRMHMVEKGVIEVLEHPHANDARAKFRMCEMAFQASFLQEGNLCPVCRAEIERTGEGDVVCGHLTFTSVI